VRETRLLSVSCESASTPAPYPGFHPLPPRTGREVFPHTALRQPSTGGIQGFEPPSPSRLATSSQAQWFSVFWRSSLVCAGVLVIYPGVWLAFFGHAPSLTSSLNLVEVEALPSRRVVLSHPSSVLRPSAHPKGCGLLRLLTRLPFGFPRPGLYQQLRSLWPTDPVRPLLFHRLLSSHTCPLWGPVLPTPEGSSRLLFQALHRFPGLRFR
jgi:hypothetical protein